MQAELVQPRQLPDGLVEARREGRAEPELFVLEIATYPDERLLEQVLRDMTLVYLARRALPEVLVLVLHAKGRLKAADAREMESPLGWTRWRASWRVVELWTVPAADLLAADDVGVLPWVPLARIDGPPEPIFQECRDRIDRQAPPGTRENLIAVTQMLTRLRYNDPKLLTILGGERAMIESPWLQEFEAKATSRGLEKGLQQGLQQGLQLAVMRVLQIRFGPTPLDVTAALQAIQDRARLEELMESALRCPDLATFRAGLPA